MEALIIQCLVLAQAIIMFSLGIGLEVADFRRVLERKYPFLVALFCQVVILPLCAFATVHVFEFSPVTAAGLMILSFCPGGVTSNIISKVSKGDVALSVSLTAVVSLLSFVTVPFFIMWSIHHFLGEDSVSISVTNLALITFLITTTPVSIGVFVRHNWLHIAKKIEPKLEKIAMVLWTIIVILAIAKTFDKLVENIAILGTGLLFLPLVMMMVGAILGYVLGLTIKESKTMAIETSIQNSPMALILAATISGGISSGVTELALPAAVYSITMYMVAIPFIFIFRNWPRERRHIVCPLSQS